jgi:hypothetical protein
MKLKNFLAFFIVTIMLFGALPKVNASVISISNVTPVTGNPGTALLGGAVPATRITVTGQAEKNDVVQIFWSGASLPSTSNCNPADCIASTGASGSYTVVFNVPLSTVGGHAITAHSQIENANATQIFTVNPIIELTPRLGVVGTSVKAYGSGFATNSPATITFDNAATQSGSTDSSGSLQSALGSFLTFTIPDSVHGPHDVRVTDGSNNQARFLPPLGPFNTLRNVEIMSPQTPVVGSRVTGRGTGFNSVESVTLFFSQGTVPSSALNGERALGQFLTDGHGTFPFSDLIPPTPQFASPPASIYNYVANDTVLTGPSCLGASSSSGCASHGLALNPLLTLTPDHAPLTQQVSALGQGFSANLRQGGITVLLQGGSLATPITLLSTGSTDLTGSFTVVFNIPSGVRPGSYIVNATDSHSFIALARLILGTHILTCPGEECPPSVAQGIARNQHGEIRGTIVTIHGLVFTANSMVQVMFDGSTIVIATADSNGDFVTNIEIPEAAGGSGQRISAIDNAHSPRTASAPFTVVPWIKLDSQNGQVGSTAVTVWGSGFPSNTMAANADVRYCGLNAGGDTLSPALPGSACPTISVFGLDSQRRIGTATTWTVFTTGDTSGGASTDVASGVALDTLGSFTAHFNVPESWGGPHPITADAVDSTGITVVSTSINSLIFRVLPLISMDPQSGQRDRVVTLSGQGFSQWEHFITNIGTPQQNEVIHQTSLVVDFGPIQRYIDQAHFILNGQVDLAWAQNLYTPIALNPSGTIIYFDSLFQRVGSTGSQFVKIPSLEPADGYTITAYYFTMSSPNYCKDPTQCDTSSLNFNVTSPEIQRINDHTDSAVNNMILPMLDKINANVNTVFKEVDTIGGNIMSDLDNSVKPFITSATAGVTHDVNANTNIARDNINANVGLMTAGVTHDVNANTNIARDNINANVGLMTAGVTHDVNANTNTVRDNVNANTNTATAGVTSAVNSVLNTKASQDSVNSLSSSVNNLQGSVNTAAQGVSSLQTNLPQTVQTPLGYVIVVLAAIAAIASIGAVFITSRRLKVAG